MHLSEYWAPCPKDIINPRDLVSWCNMSNLSLSLTTLTCNASQKNRKQRKLQKFLWPIDNIFNAVKKQEERSFQRGLRTTIMKGKNIFGPLCSFWKWLANNVYNISFLGKYILSRVLAIKSKWPFIWQKHTRLLYCHNKISSFSSSMHLRAKTYVASCWNWL